MYILLCFRINYKRKVILIKLSQLTDIHEQKVVLIDFKMISLDKVWFWRQWEAKLAGKEDLRLPV